MHTRLTSLLKEIQTEGYVKVTYDLICDAFENNFNPMKGETKDSECKRWLEWASVVYKFTYWEVANDVVRIIYFKKNEHPRHT